MQHKESQFSCTDGTQLYCRSWIPQEQLQAALIIVHGFSDHSGRYMPIVKILISRGIAVYSFDLRGHGRSPGRRGYIESFASYRDDLLIFTRHVAVQQPDLPLFLLGHSMGGLIVLNFGQRYPKAVNGIIATSPHLSDPPVSPLLIALSRTLSNIWPTFSIDAGMDNTGISRDPTIVQDFQDDPLRHGKGTPRLATELSKAVIETNANAAGFQPSLLITHGTADRMTSPEASRRFYEKVASNNKTYIAYEGGYHEGHNDIHRERVTIDIAQWLEEQIRIIAQQPENRE